MASAQDKIKSLFEDLGKATLRGVRKCPKCGTFNGTRGISCKNKVCDVVFKEKEKKKTNNIEAVKIVTGTAVQVFSVRLRDRGPDYRGFVQLPLVQDVHGNPATLVDPSILATAARCYVDNCVNRSSCMVGMTETCNHIKAAVECRTEAQPLTLKTSVLTSLQVNSEMKQAIWLLATESTGPVVQRVSKNIMVVKCKSSQKNLLGYLHFAFFEITNKKGQQQATHRFQCSCKATKNKVEERRCVHFYACICAFASDEKLQEEFSFFINLDGPTVPHPVSTIPVSSNLDELAVEMPESPAPEEHLITVIETDLQTHTHEALEVVVTDEPMETPAKKEKKEEIVQASNALLTLQESETKPTRQFISVKNLLTPPKQPTIVKRVNPFGSGQGIEEAEVATTFHSWLASVTERINQTMHYQFDGNPDPLVFHAPQVFFDCLQQRISAGCKKKRLPNFTTAFIRKDALPLGTFTKYTWHITNIIQVKQIFDTPEMPLEITRNFIQNRDSTYDLYEVPKLENCGDKLPIRPSELKTYLKVGNTTIDQKEPTPFIIEWIPDILPKSHIGELRIKFEYGHQRNGFIEQRVGNATISTDQPASSAATARQKTPIENF